MLRKCIGCNVVVLVLVGGAVFADSLGDLAKPRDGRSMRATSTHTIGADGKYDPNGEPDPQSNWDNKNVAPGETKVLMNAKGPGVITHIWMTFLGPAPHAWAKDGSANHQEMLLRIYWDGGERPGVEAPVGDFFANSFGKRSEIISLPVAVEDAPDHPPAFPGAPSPHHERRAHRGRGPAASRRDQPGPQRGALS